MLVFRDLVPGTLSRASKERSREIQDKAENGVNVRVSLVLK